jgi:hypothetical protein
MDPTSFGGSRPHATSNTFGIAHTCLVTENKGLNGEGRYHVIPYNTNEHNNLGKNNDAHIFWLRLSHDTIFKKFKKIDPHFIFVRTPLR